MVLDSLQFKAMESGIKALSLKQQVVSQNIANIDTPNYKAKEFSFENVLDDVVNSGNSSGEDKKNYDFEATITENSDTSINVDGNNVDAENESLELYSTYLQSAALIKKYNSAVSDLRYVLTQSSFK